MPDPVGTYLLDLDSFDRDFQVEYRGAITIDDNPSVAQYYRIEVFSVYGNEPIRSLYEGEYFSDEDAVDGRIRSKFSAYSWDDENGSRPRVVFVLSSITEDHYRYGKVLETYEPNNPFSEPTPLPNNIEGGLGIFSISNSEILEL